MSQELIAARAPDDLSRYRAMSDDELAAAFSELLCVTARNMLLAAALYGIAKERGMAERLRGLGCALLEWIALIHEGRLLADAVVRFFTNRRVMRRVAALPLQEQKRLAEGEKIKLVVRGESGTFTHVLKDPQRLDQSEWKLVSEGGRLRSESEQQVELQRQAERRKARVLPETVGRFALDQFGLVVGKYVVTWDEMEEALRHHKQAKRA